MRKGMDPAARRESEKLKKQAVLNRSFLETQSMKAEAQQTFVFHDTTWWSLSIKQRVPKGHCKSFIVMLHKPMPKHEVKRRLRQVFR